MCVRTSSRAGTPISLTPPIWVDRAELWNVPVQLGLSNALLSVKSSVFMSKQAGMRDNTRVTGTSGVFFIDLMTYFRDVLQPRLLRPQLGGPKVSGRQQAGHGLFPHPAAYAHPRGPQRRHKVLHARRGAAAGAHDQDARGEPAQRQRRVRGHARGRHGRADGAAQDGRRLVLPPAAAARAETAPTAGEVFRDYVLPYVPFGSGPEEKYKGALVLEPVVGYYEEPVGVLDFASLYPSLMRWKRMSPETLVPGGRRAAQKMSRSLTAAGVDHEVVTIDGMDEDSNDAPGPRDTSFIIVEGSDPITPALLKDYAAERKRYKAERNKWPVESPEWFLFEGFQLAVKVQMNSFYGTFGAELFWGTRAISEAVTLGGPPRHHAGARQRARGVKELRRRRHLRHSRAVRRHRQRHVRLPRHARLARVRAHRRARVRAPRAQHHGGAVPGRRVHGPRVRKGLRAFPDA